MGISGTDLKQQEAYALFADALRSASVQGAVSVGAGELALTSVQRHEQPRWPGFTFSGEAPTPTSIGLSESRAEVLRGHRSTQAETIRRTEP